MNEEILTPDKVEMLIKIAPTGEETGQLQGNTLLLICFDCTNFALTSFYFC